MPLRGDAKKAANRRYRRENRQRRLQTANQGDKQTFVRLRLDEPLVGRANRIVTEANTTGRYRWRTMQECLRGLILLGFDAMKDDPFLEEMMPYIQLRQQLDAVAGIRKEARAIASLAKTEIRELLAIGAKVGAARHYHTVMDNARKMPKNEWSAWLLRELPKEFPQLADEEAKGIRLLRAGRVREALHPTRGVKLSVRGGARA